MGRVGNFVFRPDRPDEGPTDGPRDGPDDGPRDGPGNGSNDGPHNASRSSKEISRCNLLVLIV